MRFRRAGVVGGRICFVLLVLLVTPATAQSVNKELIDQFNAQLLYVALPLMLFVEVILVYAVVRFRNNDNPLPTTKDRSLEITWTVATAIILLFVGVTAYAVLANPYITPQQPMNSQQSNAGASFSDFSESSGESDPVVVNVLAYQWGWQFTYPNANITTQGELVVPTDTNIRLRMTSVDVVHSLFIPELGVKQDVFPEQTTVIRTHVYEPGQYQLYCTEFCGSGHSRMKANVRAVNESQYRQWTQQHRGQRNTTNATSPALVL